MFAVFYSYFSVAETTSEGDGLQKKKSLSREGDADTSEDTSEDGDDLNRKSEKTLLILVLNTIARTGWYSAEIKSGILSPFQYVDNSSS